MKLDLSSLELAVSSLGIALERYSQEPSDLVVQDSVIQRFELTYGLTLKIMKRFLVSASDNTDEVEGMTFQQKIRAANENGLLKSDYETWMNYREKRNVTSQAYDGENVQEVMQSVKPFYEEAKYLLEKLKEHNG